MQQQQPPQQLEDLLSPEDFQRLLLEQFQKYLTNQEKPKESAPSVSDAILESSTNESSWAGAAGTMFKSALSAVKSSLRTHSHLVSFVTEQMAEIIALEASSLTKLTNLVILFYGLQTYLQLHTHSETLLPLLKEVDRRLWAGVPFINLTQEIHTGFEQTLATFKEKHYNKNPAANIDHLNLGITVSLEHINFLNDQREKSNSPDGNRALVKADRLQFMMMFVFQIMQAKNLMSFNTSIIKSSQASRYKTSVSIEFNDPKAMAYRLAWQYRCNARDNMITWSERDQPIWNDNLVNRYPRFPAIGNGGLIPIMQITSLEDLLDITKPAPCMGNVYGMHLNDFDKRYQLQSSTAQSGADVYHY